MTYVLYQLISALSLLLAVIFYFVLQHFGINLTLTNGLANVNFLLTAVTFLVANIPLMVITFYYWITATLTVKRLFWSYLLFLAICLCTLGLFNSMELYQLNKQK